MNEVIIIGGGPAGAALGGYLSKAGIQNVILEGAIHPREHVGESMVMSCVKVFQDLDFLETMENSGSIRKYGASWHETKGRESSLTFADFPQDGVNQSYTYHVDRSTFDLNLLKHAEKLGSQVYQGVQVKKVLFKNGQAHGVRARVADKEFNLESRLVVDASGRNTLLGKQLKIKRNDPIFNQYAVHTWFEGVDRGEGYTEEYIHIYFLPVERGWAWQIPVSATQTSIGVVTEREVFRSFKGDIEQFFNHYVQSNDGLAKAVKNATRIKKLTTEGDYSYQMERFVGDGWLLVGDAARFVDPIFSSGISVALSSAKFASEVIIPALKHDDLSVNAFLSYEEKLKAGVNIWYEFILLYYKLLPLFTRFIRSEKYKADIHRLLQGNVFDRKESPVLDAMREYIKKVESTENHIFKGQLTNLPIDEFPIPE